MIRKDTKMVRTHCLVIYYNSPEIFQSSLKSDLSLLGAGDMTEVGEKGLTLRSYMVVMEMHTLT
jgi:hypothetical protein